MKTDPTPTKQNASPSIGTETLCGGFHELALLCINRVDCIRSTHLPRGDRGWLRAAGWIALVVGVLSQPTDAAFVAMGDDAGSFGETTDYVAVPFEATNNDAGTEYLQFDANAFAAFVQDIYNFGGNSTTFSTVADMVAGQTNGKDYFYFVLGSNPDYVNSGWLATINNDGSLSLKNPFDTDVNEYTGEKWLSTSVTPVENNTAKGTYFANKGLLDANGDAGDYSFGDFSSGDLQVIMSTNTYQTDFGQPAGVAATSGGGTRTADANYVTAVIPEPGTLGLLAVALAALDLSAGWRRRTGHLLR